MSFWERLRASCFSRTDKAIVREVRDNLLKRPQLDSQAFANTYFPEEKHTIARKLWEITKEHSVADITGMVPEDRFVEDLKMDDLDSMSLVELTIHFEKEFNVSIPDGRLKEIKTFRELVDEICRLKRNGIIRDPSTSSG
jgi:acyl carrier protein